MDRAGVEGDAGRFEIRRAGSGDAAAIRSVLVAAFEPLRDRYTPAAFDATVIDEDVIVRRLALGPTWVAERGGRIVGTGSALATDEGLYIRSMGVLPEARGLGIGEALLGEIEGHARECGIARQFLRTAVFLDAAIRLYERHGFERCGPEEFDFHGTRLITMERQGAACGEASAR